jgi:probable addiction module antidote protein
VALQTSPFDPADHLTDADSQAVLLADAFASGDPAYITNALGIVARARGMTQTAREAGVTREALYKALATTGDPRLSTLIGVARSLGYRLSLTPLPPNG